MRGTATALQGNFSLAHNRSAAIARCVDSKSARRRDTKVVPYGWIKLCAAVSVSMMVYMLEMVPTRTSPSFLK
jgi:hypothetical protein